MQIAKSIAELRSARRLMPGITGLVPTMGALHEGHLSLVRAAKKSSDRVIATIFVNPTQFGPNEDLDTYPRTFEADCALLENEGVDLLFAPPREEMYPAGETTRILVGPVADRLDGASRPGHFTGVATIVAKLFHLATPHKAFFGQKDAAQVAVLRQMVRDLNFDLELVVEPIVREPGGLAMSSRNRYLSAEERRQALVLSHALNTAASAYRQGQFHAEDLIGLIHTVIDTEKEVRLDYIALVDPDTLQPLATAVPGALLAIAAHVGTTRLIDNQLL